MKRTVAVLEENRRLADGVHVLVLRGERFADDVRPGQFAMLRAPGPEPLLARPMAYMTADGSRASFGMKVVGRGTALLARTPPGTELVVWGPLGRPFAAPAPGIRHVLVGGGIGVPPLVMQARSLVAAGAAIDAVLVGSRTAGELFGRAEFAALGLRPLVSTDDGSEGHHGRVTDLLARVPLGRDVRVQACGPTPMLAAVARLAANAAARSELSLEARMGCGVGACRGCMVPVSAEAKAAPGGVFEGRELLCLCLDGPVVDARDVDLAALERIH